MRRTPRPRTLQPSETNEPRVNHRIRVPRVLVIDEEGNKLGEFLTEDAIQLAKDRGLDLIEVAPNGRPPVCRITDYGKLKYEKKKKTSAAKKKQTQVLNKEIKLRPKTDDHDLAVKVGHTKRFLMAGHKVKITVRFRGRELAHRDIGADQCMRVAEMVGELGKIESAPRMEGRQMFMILAPGKRPVVMRPRPEGGEEPVEEEIDDLSDIPEDDDDDFDDDDDEDEDVGEAEAGA